MARFLCPENDRRKRVGQPVQLVRINAGQSKISIVSDDAVDTAQGDRRGHGAGLFRGPQTLDTDPEIDTIATSTRRFFEARHRVPARAEIGGQTTCRGRGLEIDVAVIPYTQNSPIHRHTRKEHEQC